MPTPRQTTNIIVAVVLAVAVIGIGVAGFRQVVGADTITPGYATCKIKLDVSIPQAMSFPVKITLTPSAGQRYYFKEREFSFDKGGGYTAFWYIKKIPGGQYTIQLTSSSGMELDKTTVTLTSDKANDCGTAVLNLGLPPEETPAAEVSPTATAETGIGTTAETSLESPHGPETEGSTPAPPPVPELP